MKNINMRNLSIQHVFRALNENIMAIEDELNAGARGDEMDKLLSEKAVAIEIRGNLRKISVVDDDNNNAKYIKQALALAEKHYTDTPYSTEQEILDELCSAMEYANPAELRNAIKDDNSKPSLDNERGKSPAQNTDGPKGPSLS